MASSVFISYRRSDQRHAELLHRLLAERGIESWYDALLGAGEDWRTKTAQALVDAPIFVLLFSKNAAQSDDIIGELSAATFQKKTVIPVRIEDIHPEGAFLYELASRNWFDAFKNTDARMAVLADQLAGLVHGGAEAKAAAAKLGAVVPLPPKKEKRRGWVTLGVVGKYYVQTVPEINGLIALDVSDPAKPVEASRIAFDKKFSMPHWVAADRKSDRLVATGNDLSWALVVKLDPETGAMTVDEALPDGVNFDRASWPHGASGPAKVHGALFGQ